MPAFLRAFMPPTMGAQIGVHHKGRKKMAAEKTIGDPIKRTLEALKKERTQMATSISVLDRTISSLEGASSERRKRKSGPKGIDWDSVALGKKRDAEIAREMGVRASSVCTARTVRGIPAFGKGKKPKAGGKKKVLPQLQQQPCR